MNSKNEITQQIKTKAIEVGFNAVGIAKAEKLQGFELALNHWLDKNYQGEMSYMERNRDKRSDPTLLVEGAKSIISLIITYYPEHQQSKELPQVSKYAYSTDYHFVLKEKMQLIWNELEILYPELDGRMFVDSAPISDKHWAVQAGLGWLGKNSCLINKDIGSFVFICELLVNIELEYDEPYRSNFCGSCTKCIDACPTNAIVQPGVVDGRKCISYQTIENKNETIPIELKGKFENCLFGCDICQDVCPWNKEPLLTAVEEFQIIPFIRESQITDWEKLNQEEFNRLFRKSPLKRSKHKGVLRNLKFIQK